MRRNISLPLLSNFFAGGDPLKTITKIILRVVVILVTKIPRIKLSVAGLRLEHGKSDCPNCYRCGGNNDRVFECSTAEETYARQKQLVQNSEEPGPEPAAFTSAYELTAYTSVDFSREYGESKIWYGDAGAIHHMTFSKRKVYDFDASKGGRVSRYSGGWYCSQTMGYSFIRPQQLSS